MLDLVVLILVLLVVVVVVALAGLYLSDRRRSSTPPAPTGLLAPAPAVAAAPAESSPPALSEAQLAALTAEANRRADAEAASIIELAKREAQALRRTARTEADALGAQAERAAVARADEEVSRRTAELTQGAADLAAKERAADQAAAALDRRDREVADAERALARGQSQLSERGAELDAAAADLDAQRAQLADRAAALAAQESALAAQAEAAAGAAQAELERIGALSAQDARQEVLRAAETGARREVAIMVRDLEAEARAEADDRARRIVAESVQRVASEQTAETVVSVMHLASEEMKGRIIGREGRNIRSFEAVTGVNVIIDDTPEAVLLSCFDPVRREVGRRTLEALLADGRIHPHRIEEVHERSRAEVDALCLRAAQDALLELRIDDLDPRLLPVLGRLRFRTSYGQNVLAHSLESAHVAGVIAAEMGLEPALLQRCAFLHDIGKALTHEVEGSHAIVGAALLRRHGESEAVAHAVEAHHNEVLPTTIEAVLTQAADACSAARPGARRESIESYVTRLQRIEAIASAREGVDKVFAMQAGREVRVMVSPDAIDDLEAGVIAREIAKQIEDELTYPGQIRVTVVRESRATEIAH